MMVSLILHVAGNGLSFTNQVADADSVTSACRSHRGLQQEVAISGPIRFGVEVRFET